MVITFFLELHLHCVLLYVLQLIIIVCFLYYPTQCNALQVIIVLHNNDSMQAQSDPTKSEIGLSIFTKIFVSLWEFLALAQIHNLALSINFSRSLICLYCLFAKRSDTKNSFVTYFVVAKSEKREHKMTIKSICPTLWKLYVRIYSPLLLERQNQISSSTSHPL